MTASCRYFTALSNLPPGGQGRNLHTALLGAANHGVMAGLTEEQIHADLRAAIPSAGRHVPDREIRDAVAKAMEDRPGCYSRQRHHRPFRQAQQPPPIDGDTMRQRIIDRAQISEEVDLWESSPLRLWDGPEHDAALFLQTMFEPDDLVFIGSRQDPGIPGHNIRTAAEWVQRFHAGETAGGLVCVNPLTGEPAPKKSGDGETYRGDGNVAAFRYALAEFDTIPREDQIKFWAGSKLPIQALVDSGNKSIHAWLKVDIDSTGAWDREIRERLYQQFLIPMGVDRACSNPARLARLPGVYRKEKSNWQRLLYLSAKEGRTT